jgi:hypothetical protein
MDHLLGRGENFKSERWVLPHLYFLSLPWAAGADTLQRDLCNCQVFSKVRKPATFALIYAIFPSFFQVATYKTADKRSTGLTRSSRSQSQSAGSSELPRVTSSELSYLLSQPRTPRVIIHLLGSCGLTHGHIAKALGVKTSSIANWSSGKSEPSDELYERLDLLRTIASHVLVNRLEGDDERIVKAFLLGMPKGVVDDRGTPCTTLEALAGGRDEVVIEAALAFGAATQFTHTPLIR